MIISVDAEKDLTKLNTIHEKKSQESGCTATLPQHNKGHI